MSYLGNEPPQLAGYSTQTKAAPVGSSIALDQEGTINSTLLFLDGVRQTPTTDYTISGTTLTLTSTAPTAAVATILFLGDVTDIGQPSNDTVDVDQLNTTSAGTTGQFLKKTGASTVDWGTVTTDTSGIEDDVALLGFKVATNGSWSKYNLVDQTEDAFVDATGIDASESVNETRSGSNYYTGTATAPTGGTIDTYTDSGTDYRSHTFLDDGVFTVVSGTISADYFMVAGGGGGGNAGDGTGSWGAAGAGGAGGFLTDTSVSLIEQAYTITSGDGGAGAGYQASVENGTNGENSIIAPVSGTTYTAIGGGAGASGVGLSTGNAGGSGGGGAYSTRASGVGTAGPPRQGYDGGDNTYVSSGAAGGGGGAIGGAASAGGPMGGTGVSNNYRDGSAGTTKGTNYFAGGGSGGAYNGTAGLINAYGGGAGGIRFGTVNGTSNGSAAVANTGGGGGGGSTSSSDSASTGGAGGAGGKGIVVIRYEDVGFGTNNMTLVSLATTAETAPTKGDIVMTYTNGIAGVGGVTAINTDLTAEYSANDGGAWTSMTLVAQGSTGTAAPSFIVSAHDVALATASGTAMRYRIKTLNQGAAKETRIQAVSLGWS